MACGCGQHAITKYRLLGTDGRAQGDYDTLQAARDANTASFAGKGVIRTVRLPKVAQAA